MNLKTIISLALLSFTFANICEQFTLNDNCDFYIECLEKQFNCGSSGYPVGYGHKYCNRFVQSLPFFAQNGKVWVMKTLVCLKKHLFPLSQIRSTMCDNIHKT